jgi:hypothetical protein
MEPERTAQGPAPPEPEPPAIAIPEGYAASTDTTLDDNVVHAICLVTPDIVSSVDQTLDHLSASVDLFDVPPFDFGDLGDVG